ncbi:T9SS type B sorting domain-containing protein [Flavobacterium sp. N1736]|uniref:T9SS type B sorting domain-containing protein n=1 Tax=Flavobacterium sp. N1736 TaxID=2986823 RepID=UPI0022252C4D|nr:T9SS type B sorting domain-containing protein [Flavobacterium sp. N1736]
MKKPTILRTLIFALALLLNFASYSQNLIAYNSKFEDNRHENIFLKAKNQSGDTVSLDTTVTGTDKMAAPIIPNPVIKYATGSYAGSVSTCPNNGEQLPKLFLCGKNDARLIDTGILPANATIVWSKLKTGTGCTAFANTNCPNYAAACGWDYLSTGQTFSADTAGEYKLVITYTDKTVFTFYFNVYTSDIDPTNISKSNIITGTTGSCTLPGRIIVNGFNASYEYTISASSNGTTAPTTGWQDSPIFGNITTARNYNVFIRLKNVPGSCVFRVLNVPITTAAVNVATTIIDPKCSGDGGSILVKTNDVGLNYTYRLYKGATLVTTITNSGSPEYTFTGLAQANNYRVEVEISSTNSTCHPYNTSPNNLTIKAPPSSLSATLTDIATASGCSTKNLQINATGGTSPYKYFLSINSGAFVPNTSTTVVVTTPGTYTVRVEDANGCQFTTSITRSAVTKPDYVVTPTSPNCSITKGSIKVTVNNANGYSMGYSLNSTNNGDYVSGTTGTTYSNLNPGTYTVYVRYRIGNSGTWCVDTNVVTITDAPNGLTASAGVAALAGCGADGKSGIVKIANPSGGIPPYTYSFDGGNTFIASNQADMAPNPGSPTGYTVYIKDSSPTPCIYSMSGIVIDAKPANPDVIFSGVTYDCNGFGTITATATNPGGVNYTYTYKIDGVENTNIPANVFTNIGSGQHTIEVVYNLQKVSTYSNLLSEDFGRGNPTTSPGINTAYCFENMSGTHPTDYPCNKDNNINDGEYAVTNYITYRFGTWLDIRDHTSAAGPVDSQGRFLAINIGGVAGVGGIIYRKPIYDVIPNQDVKISFWVENLIEGGKNYPDVDPDITIELIADFGLPTQTLVASQATGIIPKSNKWENYNMDLNPGNYTTLDFVVRSYSIATGGNDLTLDDIKVYQVPRICGDKFETKFTVPKDNAFDAEIIPVGDVSCNGKADGSFKIVVKNFGDKWEYSLNGGVAGSWIESTALEVLVQGLAAKTYDVRVRRAGTATSPCEKTLSPIVTEKAVFDIKVTKIDATCASNNLGTVDASGTTGGTIPYHLVLIDNTDPTKIYPFPVGSYILNDVKPGNYTVSGTDDRACSDIGSTNLTIKPADAPKAELAHSSGLCFGNGSAIITVNITDGVGPYTYQVSYNGGALSAPVAEFPSPTFTYNATAPGTYDFTIIDKSNGCKVILASQKVDPKITATTAIKNSLTCDPATPDATIEVTITGGTSPYTYTVTNKATGVVLFTSGTIAGPTFTYSTQNAGTYTFDVTDKNGCTTTIDGTVDSLVPVIATRTPINPTCNAGTNGSVQLAGSGGVGPYMFSFNGSAFTTQSLYTGLAAGTYGYQVRDSNQCLSTAGTVTLTAPNPITATRTFTPYTCLQTATITVTSPSGGTGAYEYSINGTTFQTSATFTGLTNGTYTITVRDANMCTATLAPVTIAPLTPPTALAFSNSALTCPTNKVNITVTSTGGFGTKTYSITAPASAIGNTSGLNNGIFTNLDPGTYTFQVKDQKDCTYSDSFTVAPLPALTVTGTRTNVQCSGSSTGTAQFIVNGSTGFTYTLNTVAQTGTTSPINLTGLAAGTYTVEVTNTATGCTATASVTIAAPAAALALSNTPTPITCDAPGSVTLTATGGWGGNSYSLTQPDGTILGPQASNTFSNLTQTGNYTASVTDSNNCNITSPFTLSTPVKPIASVTGSDICYDATNQATITVTVTNGVAPYQYSINNGATYQAGNTFSGLVPGTYTVLVKDAYGCTSTAIVQPIANQLAVGTVLTKDIDCNVPPAARITGTVSGGTAPITYSVSINGAPYTLVGTVAGTTFTYDTTTAGTYQFQVNDASTCQAVSTVSTVHALTPVTATRTPINPTCNAGTNGSVQLAGSGGVGPYMFSFNGSAFTTQSLYTGLAAGTYGYQVRDSNQCLSTAGTVTLTAPNPITATRTFTPYTCLQTATITVTSPSGGTGAYEYSINGTTFQTSATFTGLTNGTYTITVRDANMCTATLAPVTIAPLTPPTALAFSNSALTCPTNKVNITVTSTGGFGTKTYSITAPASAIGNTSGLNNGIFTNLDPGTYTFQVKDQKDCTYSDSFTVAPLPALTVTGTRTNVQCSGSSTGTAQFIVNGSTGFTYTLNTVAQTGTTSPINLTGLAAGTYTVEVTNTATGCTATASVTIAAPAAALALSNTPTPITCDAPGSVTLTATGGWGGNSYSLTQPDGTILGPQASNTFSNLTQTGNYTASVTDSNNCNITSPFTLSTPVKPIASVTGSDICYDATNQATITVTVTNGVAPYQYSINNGATYQAGNTFSGLVPGTYTVLVKDAYGCTSTAIVQPIANQLAVGTVLTKDIDCNVPPAARITGTVSGGTAPITYSVSINGAPYTLVGTVAGTTFTYDTTTAGTYQFQVNDASTCQAVSTVSTVHALTPVTATRTPINPTCNAGTNGSVQLAGSGGVGPYMFSFNGSAFTTQSLYTGLAAGTYGYQVRDSNQCLSTAGTVTLTAPNPITATTTVTPYTCLQTATITVTSPSGGTGAYEYSINGTTFQTSATFTGLTNGTYTITVRDANMCTATLAPVTIAPLTPPTALAFSNSALTCPTNKVSITVTSTGGFGTKTYSITAPASAIGNTSGLNNGIFTNLDPGTYTFQVKDQKDCTYSDSFTVAPLPALTVTGTRTNVQCSGTLTGTAQFIVNGSTGFTYTLNTVAQTGTTSPINLPGLAAGTYTVEVTNTATGCTATASVTIAAPAAALALSNTPTPITCDAPGSVTLTATGGWGGNAYSLTQPDGTILGPQASNTFSNLTQTGNYTASVTDSNNCNITSPFTLSTPVKPIASVTGSDICYDATNQATITVTVTNGVAPYQYSINNGATYQAGNTFSGLVPGTYTVLVKDAYGCTSTAIVQPIANQLQVSTVLTNGPKCTAPDITIDGTVNAGTPNYTYTVTINGTLDPTVHAVVGNAFTYTDATAVTATTPTTYLFTFSDAAGCSATSTVIVQPKTNPDFTAVQGNLIYCNGQATGSITVTIDTTVGAAPYVINVVKDNTLLAIPNVNYGTQTTGLPGGDYIVTVTDANGCLLTKNVTITQPNQIVFTEAVTQITCVGGGAGTSLGSIAVTALTGGTTSGLPLPAKSGFVYTLTSNTSATQTFAPDAKEDHSFQILNFGIYELTVTDFNGCSVTKTINIASPPQDLTIDVTQGAASCTNATVVVSVNPPIPGGPYHFALYPVNPLNPNDYDYLTHLAAYHDADAVSPPALPGDPNLLKATFTGLNPGVLYSFIVYDESTNCYFFKQADTKTPTLSTLTSTVTPANVTCIGAADGSVSFTFTKNFPTLTTVSYQIYNSQTNQAVTPAITGTVPGLIGTVTSPVITAGPLAPGTYYILFTEVGGSNPGCKNSSATFTITQSVIPLKVNATVNRTENCNKLGNISVAAQGGTAPYMYQVLLSSAPAPVAADTNWVTDTSFDLAAGSYIAYAKDANGCIQFTTVKIIGLDPTPVVAAALAAQCNVVEGNFVINVTVPTAGMSPYTFSVDGGAFQSRTAPFSITGLSSGSHTVAIKDVNGCGNTVPVSILSPLGILADIAALPTCADNDGSIKVTATGGSASANYRYTLLNTVTSVTTGPQVSDTFTGLAAGTYDVTVTDIAAASGCSVTKPVVLTKPTPVTFSTTQINVSCFGGNDGKITVVLPATNDNPPYTYTLTSTTGLPVVSVTQLNNNVFAGLTAREYSITVTSARGGCTTPQLVTITEVNPVTITSVAVPAFECAPDNSVNTTTVTINAQDGHIPYTYSINGTDYFSSNVFTVADTGASTTLHVYVKDLNGCIDDEFVPITTIPKITNVTVAGTNIDCLNAGRATITATGGSGDFSYQLLPSGAPQANNFFIITAPGDYYFRVIDNITHCYYDAPVFKVAPYNVINLVATATTPVSCFGDSNGALSINVSNYTGTYDYSVLNGAGTSVLGPISTDTTVNPRVIAGLLAGNYTVVVTETASPFCSVTSNVVTIGSPSAAVTLKPAVIVNDNCNVNAGKIVAEAQGGTAPYYYQILPAVATPPLVTDAGWATTNNILNAESGNYVVYVKDANNCPQSQAVVIGLDPTPVVAAALAAQCNVVEGNFVINVTVPTAGMSPYTFSVDGGAFQSRTAPFSITGLSSGSHTVAIKDVNGCGNTVPVSILSPLGMLADIAALPTCADNDGSIKVTATGGSASANYRYTLLNTVTSVTTGPQVSDTFTGLAAGTYDVTVTDIAAASGCSVTKPVVLTKPTPVTFSTTQINVSCFGGNDGKITVVLPATNDNPPYTYTLTSTTGLPVVSVTQLNNNVFAGLTAREYSITVTSARGGCTTPQLVTITEVNPVTITSVAVPAFECAPDNSVNTTTVTINAQDGHIPYTYSINGTDYFSSNVFTVADTGASTTLHVYVKDLNGCIDDEFVPITTIPKITNVTVAGTNIDCLNAGRATITATGGSGDFSYQLLPSGAPQANNFFIITAPGDYYFRVIDNITHCYYDAPVFKVAPYNVINLVATATTPVSCFGDSNGALSINVSNYTGTYDYSVLNGAGTSVLGPISTDTTVNPRVIAGLLAGNYTVVVTETASPFCSVTSNVVTIGSPSAAVTLKPAVIVNDNCNVNAGKIVAEAQGGTAPYYYQILPAVATPPLVTDAGWATTNNILNAESGNYVVYVKDANNCPQSQAVVIGLDPTPVVAAALAAQCNVVEGNFVINVTVPTAGMSPYTFSVDGGAFQSRTAPFSITGLSSGSHTVAIKDVNGCGNTVPVSILSPLGMLADIAALPTCADNDGSIKVTATGGSASANYRYTLLNTVTSVTTGPQVSDTFTGLAAGTYDVTVTDIAAASGCSVTKPVVLTKPTPVTFSTTQINVSCFGGNDGKITVVLPATNDNPPYTYTLTSTTGLPVVSVTQLNNNVFAGLTAREYSITVTSARGGCTTPQLVTITEVNPVTITSVAVPAFECAPDNSVNTTTVTINAQDGHIPYTYSINGTDYFSSNVFTVADTGASTTLHVYVKDLNGCIDDEFVPITTIPKITNVTVAGTNIDCLNAGRATITATGGSGDFSYQLLPSGAPQANNFFIITAPGDYYFRVIDNITHCYYDAPVFKVAPYNVINLVATATTPVSCFGDSNGALSINVSNYTGTYDYSVLNGAGTSVLGPISTDTTVNPRVIAGLLAGNYTVVVTETASPFCSVTSNVVTIGSPSAAVTLKPAVIVNDNCNVNAGKIVAEAQGGTAPYYYQILPAAATPPLVTDAGWATTNNILNAESGNYVVYVKDANNCPQSQAVTIGLDPTPVVDAQLAAQCNVAEGNFVINVTVPTVGVSPYTFSIDGGAFQSRTAPFPITGLSSGNHSVAIHDVNGCGNTATVNILAPLELRAEVTKTPNCTASDGEITLTASGGTVPSGYLYTKDGWLTSQPTGVFGNLAPGSYNFIVRDIATGCEKPVSQTIEAPTLVTGITLTPRPATCNGYSDGSITVSLAASNNNPVYEYTLTNTVTLAVVGPQQSNLFSGLAAGSYSVKVTSGKGCSDTATTTIDQPNPIVVDPPLVTQYKCTTGNSPIRATITVNSVNGGAGAGHYVRYIFTRGTTVVQDGASNVYTETDFAGGSYTVKVIDDKGCDGTTTVPAIAPFISIDAIQVAVNQAITCKVPETIQITVKTTPAGATPNLSYTVTGPNGYNQTNTNGLFAGLGIGDFLMTVVNTDTGCILEDYHYVKDPNTYAIQAVATTSQICFGTTNGSVDLTFVDNQPTPSNDAGAFSYVIDSEDGTVHLTGTTANAGPFTIPNLKAGIYHVTATMVNPIGCDVETSFSIDQPLEALAINLEHTVITCAANNNGTITASATGGWTGDYQYQLVGPGNTGGYSDKYYFDNLAVGTYTVNVKDSKGCIDSDQVILTLPNAINFTATPSVTVLTCFGNKDAIITVSAPTGGVGTSYNYTLSYVYNGEIVSWGPQSSNVFTGLGSGDYTVTVRDGFSCEASSTLSIAEPTMVEPSLSTKIGNTCKTDAVLTLSVTGGTGPYSYSVDGINNFSPTFNSTVDIPALVGKHTYFVKDNLGCVSYKTNEIEVPAIEPLAMTVDANGLNVSCTGNNSGIIFVSATGGLGDYEYSLSGKETRPAQAEGIFENLYAGTYTVHVKSVDCEEDKVVVITETLTALNATFDVTPVKCWSDKDGKIVINATGGTGTIKYAISPNLSQFVENNVFTGLEAGRYTVIVQDVLGCTGGSPFYIDVLQPDILIASIIPNSVLPEICAGDKDAAFSIQVQGGVGPYFESLDNSDGPFKPFAGNIKDYVGLVGGKRSVFIKDSNGCISQVDIDMPDAVALKPTVEVNYDCVNNTQANFVKVDPGYEDHSQIDYSLDGAAFVPGNIFTNVAQGDHTITVRHTNGCPADVKFNIKAYTALGLKLDGKQEMNIISVIGTGGAPAYEYSFDGGPFTSENKFKIYESRDYIIIVRDQNGCTFEWKFPGTYYDVCLDNYFTPNGDGVYDTWGPGCTNIYNNLTYSIFDRYGRVIAKYHYGQKWDGRYNGEELPSGDYWYVLKLNDEKDDREFVGHFTLYR